MAKFAQYAMVASEEALNDAGWTPTTEDELEATVGRFQRSCGLFIDSTRVSTSAQALEA